MSRRLRRRYERLRWPSSKWNFIRDLGLDGCDDSHELALVNRSPNSSNHDW